VKRRSAERDAVGEATLSLLDQPADIVGADSGGTPQAVETTADDAAPPTRPGRTGRRDAKLVTMPQLSGLTSEAAIERLRGLELCPAPEALSTADPTEIGLVLDHLPTAGVELARGDVVDLFVGCLESEHVPAAADDDWYSVVAPDDLDSGVEPAPCHDGESPEAGAAPATRRVSRKRRARGNPGVVVAVASSRAAAVVRACGVAAPSTSTAQQLRARVLSATSWARRALGGGKRRAATVAVACGVVLALVTVAVTVGGGSRPLVADAEQTVQPVRALRVPRPAIWTATRRHRVARARKVRAPHRSHRRAGRSISSRTVQPLMPPPPIVSSPSREPAPSFDGCEACAEHVN
jgi:PASTA domain